MEQTQTLPSHDTPVDAATASDALPTSTPRQRVRLWDLPLRIFHWSLVTAVSVAIATGLAGGEWMPLHGQAGLVIVGLLSFRIVWGLWGSTYARFRTFVPSPSTLLTYLQGRWQGAGHNPLGALSVLALIGVLAAQVATGLVGNDEIAFTGPLASQVDEALSLNLTGLHHQLVNVLYVLLGLHIVAILVHVHIKKDPLIRPMVTGWKDVPASVPQPRAAGPVAFIVALGVALGAVYGGSGLWIDGVATPSTESAGASGDTAEAVSPSVSQPATPSW